MNLVVGALIAAALIMFGHFSNSDDRTPVPLDPAGAKARARAAIAKEHAEIPEPLLETVSNLETGRWLSPIFRKTRSLFNRHVGSGRGDWTGRVYDKLMAQEFPSLAARNADPRAAALDEDANEELLRVYDSLEQSVRDAVLLLRDPLYKNARAAALALNEAGFFEGIVKGDGTNGWVGNPATVKASQYLAGLNSRRGEAYA